MARLENKVIIVTGSSSGFGRGIAKACAAEGAKIVVSDARGPTPAASKTTRA